MKKQEGSPSSPAQPGGSVGSPMSSIYKFSTSPKRIVDQEIPTLPLTDWSEVPLPSVNPRPMSAAAVAVGIEAAEVVGGIDITDMWHRWSLPEDEFLKEVVKNKTQASVSKLEAKKAEESNAEEKTEKNEKEVTMMWPLRGPKKNRTISSKEARQTEMDGGWSWIWWSLAAAAKKTQGEKMEGLLVPDICTFFQGQLFHWWKMSPEGIIKEQKKKKSSDIAAVIASFRAVGEGCPHNHHNYVCVRRWVSHEGMATDFLTAEQVAEVVKDDVEKTRTVSMQAYVPSRGGVGSLLIQSYRSKQGGESIATVKRFMSVIKKAKPRDPNATGFVSNSPTYQIVLIPSKDVNLNAKLEVYTRRLVNYINSMRETPLPDLSVYYTEDTLGRIWLSWAAESSNQCFQDQLKALELELTSDLKGQASSKSLSRQLSSWAVVRSVGLLPQRAPPPTSQATTAAKEEDADGNPMLSRVRGILDSAPDKRSKKDIEFLSRFLKPIPFFAKLSTAVCEKLLRRLTFAKFGIGEAVFYEGDNGSSFYVILNGNARVAVSDTVDPTRETVVATLKAGQSFGEIALFTDDPRNATVRASMEGPLECAVLERAVFLQYAPSEKRGGSTASASTAFLDASTMKKLIIILKKPADQRMPLECEIVEKVLARVKFFESAPEGALSIISRFATLLVAEVDTAVIQQSTPGTEMFVILEGCVNVMVNSGGTQKSVTLLTAGKSFGELSLVRNTDAAASVIVREKASLLSISKHVFTAAMKRETIENDEDAKALLSLYEDIKAKATATMSNANLPGGGLSRKASMGPGMLVRRDTMIQPRGSVAVLKREGSTISGPNTPLLKPKGKSPAQSRPGSSSAATRPPSQEGGNIGRNASENINSSSSNSGGFFMTSLNIEEKDRSLPPSAASSQQLQQQQQTAVPVQADKSPKKKNNFTSSVDSRRALPKSVKGATCPICNVHYMASMVDKVVTLHMVNEARMSLLKRIPDADRVSSDSGLLRMKEALPTESFYGTVSCCRQCYNDVLKEEFYRSEERRFALSFIGENPKLKPNEDKQVALLDPLEKAFLANKEKEKKSVQDMLEHETKVTKTVAGAIQKLRRSSMLKFAAKNAAKEEEPAEADDEEELLALSSNENTPRRRRISLTAMSLQRRLSKEPPTSPLSKQAAEMKGNFEKSKLQAQVELQFKFPKLRKAAFELPDYSAHATPRMEVRITGDKWKDLMAQLDALRESAPPIFAHCLFFEMQLTRPLVFQSGINSFALQYEFLEQTCFVPLSFPKESVTSKKAIRCHWFMSSALGITQFKNEEQYIMFTLLLLPSKQPLAKYRVAIHHLGDRIVPHVQLLSRYEYPNKEYIDMIPVELMEYDPKEPSPVSTPVNNAAFQLPPAAVSRPTDGNAVDALVSNLNSPIAEDSKYEDDFEDASDVKSSANYTSDGDATPPMWFPDSPPPGKPSSSSAGTQSVKEMELVKMINVSVGMGILKSDRVRTVGTHLRIRTFKGIYLPNRPYVTKAFAPNEWSPYNSSVFDAIIREKAQLDAQKKNYQRIKEVRLATPGVTKEDEELDETDDKMPDEVKNSMFGSTGAFNEKKQKKSDKISRRLLEISKPLRPATTGGMTNDQSSERRRKGFESPPATMAERLMRTVNILSSKHPRTHSSLGNRCKTAPGPLESPTKQVNDTSTESTQANINDSSIATSSNASPMSKSSWLDTRQGRSLKHFLSRFRSSSDDLLTGDVPPRAHSSIGIYHEVDRNGMASTAPAGKQRKTVRFNQHHLGPRAVSAEPVLTKYVTPSSSSSTKSSGTQMSPRNTAPLPTRLAAHDTRTTNIDSEQPQQSPPQQHVFVPPPLPDIPPRPGTSSGLARPHTSMGDVEKRNPSFPFTNDKDHPELPPRPETSMGVQSTTPSNTMRPSTSSSVTKPSSASSRPTTSSSKDNVPTSSSASSIVPAATTNATTTSNHWTQQQQRMSEENEVIAEVEETTEEPLGEFAHSFFTQAATTTRPGSGFKTMFSADDYDDTSSSSNNNNNNNVGTIEDDSDIFPQPPVEDQEQEDEEEETRNPRKTKSKLKSKYSF